MLAHPKGLQALPLESRDPTEGHLLEPKKLCQNIIFQSIKTSVQIQHKEPLEESQAFCLWRKEERSNASN